MTRPVITAFDWVPDFAQGQVRDLRVRWILEEAGQPYHVRYLAQGAQHLLAGEQRNRNSGRAGSGRHSKQGRARAVEKSRQITLKKNVMLNWPKPLYHTAKAN